MACLECDNTKIHARGLCNTHYRRLQKAGLPKVEAKSCAVDDCEKQAATRKAANPEYCPNHRKHIKFFGEIQTPEMKHAKMSKAASKRKNTLGKKWKIKDTSKMFGRVPKSAFKKGMVAFNLGKPMPKHVKEALRLANTKYTETERLTNREQRLAFNRVRKLILARDNDTCQVCDITSDKYMHVDHIKSWAEYPELRFDMDNCRTLCMACHYYVTYKRKLPQGKFWGNKGITS